MAVATVFGAVIVLAALLGVGQLTDTSDADVVTDSTTSAPTTTGPATADEGEEASGFGDLPPDDDDAAEAAPEPDVTQPDGEAADQERPQVDSLACPDGVDPVICDAADFVQQVRGRPFRTFPEVEILDDAEFDRELLSDFDEYREDLEVDDVTLTALGLLDPEASLAETFRESLEVAVVGFYDPETGQLVVRGADFSLYSQLVLVHELVHAFDDQWFDLDRDDFADGEADYGFSAVVEGNASRVEALWREQLSSQHQLQLTQEELTALSPEDLDRLFSLPPVVQDLQGSPYLDGERYVSELAATGGEAAVDDALMTPPVTSEEILHPGTDRSIDAEIVVPAPPAGGTVIDEGRLGELVVRLWLGRLAGEGWGGDRYVTWSAGGEDCIAVDLVGDDAQETVELDAAADAWAGLGSDTRQVDSITVDGRPAVRVTACA